MTLTKILWASLTGCVSIILLMASAWAHDVTARNAEFDKRLSTAEAHYAAIQTELQNLQESVKELKVLLREKQRR